MIINSIIIAFHYYPCEKTKNLVLIHFFLIQIQLLTVYQKFWSRRWEMALIPVSRTFRQLLYYKMQRKELYNLHKTTFFKKKNMPQDAAW
jgi:hypothetical protein